MECLWSPVYQSDTNYKGGFKTLVLCCGTIPTKPGEPSFVHQLRGKKSRRSIVLGSIIIFPHLCWWKTRWTPPINHAIFGAVIPPQLGPPAVHLGRRSWPRAFYPCLWRPGSWWMAVVNRNRFFSNMGGEQKSWIFGKMGLESEELRLSCGRWITQVIGDRDTNAETGMPALYSVYIPWIFSGFQFWWVCCIPQCISFSLFSLFYHSVTFLVCWILMKRGYSPHFFCSSYFLCHIFWINSYSAIPMVFASKSWFCNPLFIVYITMVNPAMIYMCYYQLPQFYPVMLVMKIARLYPHWACIPV